MGRGELSFPLQILTVSQSWHVYSDISVVIDVFDNSEKPPIIIKHHELSIIINQYQA